MPPSGKLAPRIPDTQWDLHKNTIQVLYVEEEKTLDETIKCMENHGFIATKAQFVRKLRNWGMDKNIKAQAWEHAVSLLNEREAEGKDTELRMGNKVIPVKRLKKHLGRSDIKRRNPATEMANVASSSIVPVTPPSTTDNELSMRLSKSSDISQHLTRLVLPFLQFWSSINSISIDFQLDRPNSITRRHKPFSMSNLVLSASLQGSLLEMEENTTPSYQQLVESQPLLPLLQCAVYMVSNALLPQQKLDDMVKWVDSSGHSKVLGSFVKAKGLAIEAFASNVLVSATRVESLVVASALLEAGVSPDCKDYDCQQPYPTILEKAIKMQNISLWHSICDWAVSIAGEYVRAKGYSELCIVQMVEVLVDAGATIGDSEFRFIMHGNIPFARKVSLSKLADSVCRRGEVDEAWGTELDVKLQDAVSAGSIHTVQHLVQLGANVNCWRHHPDMVFPKPLALAVSQGNINMVRALLDLGADPTGTLSQEEFSCPALIVPAWSRDGMYLFGALHKAVQDSDAELAEMLLQHGADASSIDLYGNTPLQYAIDSKSLELVEILLNYGADTNNATRTLKRYVTDFQSSTEPIFELLLRHGLRVSLPTRHDDVNLFYMAVTEDKPNLLRILLRAYRNNSMPISEKGAIDSAMNETEDDDAREIFDDLLQTAFAYGSLECIDCLTKEMGDMGQARGTYAPDEGMAVEHRDDEVEFVMNLIDNGADINGYNESWGTRPFLQVAIQLQDFALVTFLLSRGAKVTRDPQPKDFSPLHLTMNSQNSVFVLETSKALVRHGADIHAHENMECQAEYIINMFREEIVNVTPVQFAVAQRNQRVFNWLLQEGADLNAPAAQTAGFTVLQAAIATGQDELTSQLLQLGANINALPGGEVGLTALQAAVLRPSEPLVFQLLAAGAEVNAPAASQNGRTALQAASFNGNMEIVEALLARGADVNAPPCQRAGATALQFAAMQGHLDLVMKLLEVGADVNAPPAVNDGRTALQGAAENGRLDIVHLLLQNDPDSLSDREKLENAAGFAEKRGHTAIAKLLRGWDDPFSTYSPLYGLEDL